MKAVFAALILTVSTAFANHQCETNCSASCVDMVNEYAQIVANHRRYCQGGGGCAGKLAAKRPYWSASELAAACSGAAPDCVLSLATARPYWSPSELNTACKGDSGHCAGRLASIRPYWSPSELASACGGVYGDCIVDLAKNKPYWSPSELNTACKSQ